MLLLSMGENSEADQYVGYIKPTSISYMANSFHSHIDFSYAIFFSYFSQSDTSPETSNNKSETPCSSGTAKDTETTAEHPAAEGSGT